MAKQAPLSFSNLNCLLAVVNYEVQLTDYEKLVNRTNKDSHMLVEI